MQTLGNKSKNSHRSSHLFALKLKKKPHQCVARNRLYRYLLPQSSSSSPFTHSLLLDILSSPVQHQRRRPNRTSGMANMVMASTFKTHLAVTSSLPAQKPKYPITQSSPLFLNFQTLYSTRFQLPAVSLKYLSLVGAAAAPLLMAPLPALAEEVVEKASLFDFNLTLPIIMGEFLLLMFALDKVYFSPLGNFMDQRDAAIKEKLGSISDTSSEVKQLEDQAKAVMRAARAEIAAALNKMKKETQEDLELKIKEKSKIVEAELKEALAKLEGQKEETIKALDSQIAALSEDIVKKVLPAQ